MKYEMLVLQKTYEKLSHEHELLLEQCNDLQVERDRLKQELLKHKR